MNRPTANHTQSAALPIRQMLFLGMAVLLTLAAGQFYYSVQTARLAEQVAVQTALLSELKASRASTLVKAAESLPAADTTSAVLETVVPQERWVF